MFTEIADFYQAHKTPILIVGGVVAVLLAAQFFRGGY